MIIHADKESHLRFDTLVLRTLLGSVLLAGLATKLQAQLHPAMEFTIKADPKESSSRFRLSVRGIPGSTYPVRVIKTNLLLPLLEKAVLTGISDTLHRVGVDKSGKRWLIGTDDRNRNRPDYDADATGLGGRSWKIYGKADDLDDIVPVEGVTIHGVYAEYSPSGLFRRWEGSTYVDGKLLPFNGTILDEKVALEACVADIESGNRKETTLNRDILESMVAGGHWQMCIPRGAPYNHFNHRSEEEGIARVNRNYFEPYAAAAQRMVPEERKQLRCLNKRVRTSVREQLRYWNNALKEDLVNRTPRPLSVAAQFETPDWRVRINFLQSCLDRLKGLSEQED
jgi:hypothetical protein